MRGLTDTREALILAKKVLDERDRKPPTYVFIITDAYSRNDASQAAADVRATADVTLFGVGISTQTNMYQNIIHIHQDLDIDQVRLQIRWLCDQIFLI